MDRDDENNVELTQRDQVKFLLRLPETLRDYLKESAEEGRRSLNAEIVTRLEHMKEYELQHAMEHTRIEEIYDPVDFDYPVQHESPAEIDAWKALANPPTLMLLSGRLADIEASLKLIIDKLDGDKS